MTSAVYSRHKAKRNFFDWLYSEAHKRQDYQGFIMNVNCNFGNMLWDGPFEFLGGAWVIFGETVFFFSSA